MVEEILMKYFKEQLPYGLAGFLIILFLDIGNTFTKIVNSIGRYEFATITLVMLAIVFKSFSPLSSSITNSHLNLAERFLLVRDIIKILLSLVFTVYQIH